MEKTTSRKLARTRLMERQQAAAAAREARERANIGDLTEFMVSAAEIDEVDPWLAARIEKVQAEAERKRERHRVAAGNALQRMRLRGETVTSIAAQAGLSVSRVREYLRWATDTTDGGDTGANGPDAQVVPMPNHGDRGAGGHQPSEGVSVAQ
jgi:hypothetical protein